MNDERDQWNRSISERMLAIAEKHAKKLQESGLPHEEIDRFLKELRTDVAIERVQQAARTTGG